MIRTAKHRLEYVERKTRTIMSARTVLFALCQQLAENMGEISGTTGEEEENDNTIDQELFSALVAQVENEEVIADSKVDYGWRSICVFSCI